ncbi:hypothetical protein, partial [Actinotignum urinale]|uniref:hypothetical protein n=2 Tax=Actinotignum urinale TaxID=190146 RepID=UPI002A8231B0
TKTAMPSSSYTTIKQKTRYQETKHHTHTPEKLSNYLPFPKEVSYRGADFHLFPASWARISIVVVFQPRVKRNSL